MTRWIFEPGHCAAHFSVRHMMVTEVRGGFTGVEGHLDFEPGEPVRGSVEARIPTDTLWTGEADRDDHLKSEDFLHVEEHPEMIYRGDRIEPLGCNDFRVLGELTLRGVTRPVPLDVTFLGAWETPYWKDGRDHGPVRRVGFVARGSLDRHDFDVSWSSGLDRGGVVVGSRVRIILDVEALESGVIPGI